VRHLFFFVEGTQLKILPTVVAAEDSFSNANNFSKASVEITATASPSVQN